MSLSVSYSVNLSLILSIENYHLNILSTKSDDLFIKEQISTSNTIRKASRNPEFHAFPVNVIIKTLINTFLLFVHQY